MLVLLCLQSIQAQQLKVFDSIPGRNSSEHYLCRVKFVNEPETAWRNANVLQTRAKEASEDPENAYYGILRGFTASWVSFESDFIGDNVIVEIAKRDGTPITKAMVRPVGEAQAATISSGKAYVVFTGSANINVDINGQMEDNYTGFGYNGSKVHTISIFGNPIFTPPTGTDVKVLHPNEDIRNVDRTTYPKIVFAPGVHNIGLGLPILTDQILYISGNAFVHGTIHPPNLWGNAAAKNFKVYGSGTISGENIVRDPSDPAQRTPNGKEFKPFTYQAEGAHLEGFVVVDPAYHTFNMGHSGDANNINVYKNLKILAWRVNSDGINAFKNSEVSDCFFRVQDDAFYYGAENVNQYDNTVWNDANGAVIFLQNVLDGSTSTFTDVKVIYHRAHWHWWDGGRIVSMRQYADNSTLSNVTIKNILVEDPLPAFPPFYGNILNNEDPNDSDSVITTTFNNVVFENIHQEHDGVVTNLPTGRTKPQNTLKGIDGNLFENITFKNCYFNGTTLTSFADGNFYTEFVDANTVIFLADKLEENFIAPSQVSPNENISLTVDYFASETRDLRAFIQLNRSPWTSYGSKRVTLNVGSGTKSLSFTVDPNIPLENDAYKIVINLLPVGLGWPDRLDEKIEFNVSAVSSSQKTLSNSDFIREDISIFPNPAKSQTLIKSESIIKNIKVYSLSGKLLSDKELNKKEHKINLSNYAKGLYFLAIRNDNGTILKKLIIQ